MALLNDMKEEIKDKVLDAIDSGGTTGVSLRDICSEVFDENNSDEYVQINKTYVFNVLDDLLEEGQVSFNVEEDIWTIINWLKKET